MARNTGKKSEDIFKEAMEGKGKGTFVFRLMDKAEVFGRNKRRPGGPSGNVRPQPSDFIVVDGGETYFAEVKSTENPRSFSKNLWKPTQRAMAAMITAAGGSYYLFIHSLATNRWFRVPARFFLEKQKTVFAWDELMEFEHDLP